MLTISQLAAYAGVTVRAVRHYHAKGLLPEPERDASGYRRYDARAVVELIRIRTLAEAGVPLARVRELLAADEDEFAAAVHEIDARLRSEIRERQRHRKRIARLAAGDNIALPSEAVAYLDRLRELGLSERMVQGERDGWILLAADSPERMSELLAEKRKLIEDPELIEIYRDLDEAIEWESDDPRLPGLADRIAAHTERVMAPQGSSAEVREPGASHPVASVDYADEEVLTEGTVELVDEFFRDEVPAARRLLALLEERGWSGWTHLRPASR